jgi:hypothetical protein
MDLTITRDSICTLSEDIVARKIEDELVIVPLTSGIGNMEDELYTLNETAQAIWGRLDGAHSLGQIVTELANEYNASAADIERDVIGLVTELVRCKILVLR